MSFKNFYNKLVGVIVKTKNLLYVPGAVSDPNGFGMINLMLENANVLEKYKFMFFPKEDNSVFIDCGMNVGLLTDIARKMDMEVYGFEPNPAAVKLLKKKYSKDDLVHIYPFAVDDKKGEMDFYTNSQYLFDQGATIIKEGAEFEGGGRVEEPFKIPVVRLTDVIENDILKNHKFIHLLKIDIEGAEFGVVTDLIKRGLYKNIRYIVVETHERFFKDGNQRLINLKKIIKEYQIENIYLDRN